MHDSKPTEQPGRYGAIVSVLREMGWTWRDLNETPNDLIEEVIAHMSYQKMWERKRAELDKQRAGHGKKS